MRTIVPPINTAGYVGKPRSSNLELYRIICMIMIVAHHYVMSVNAAFSESLESANSIFLSLFGAWGKTGINCFMMITGYFMCTSKITIKKFLKLMLQVYFYQIIIYLIFLIAGKETVSFQRIMVLLMPVWGFSKNFTSCFIAFWLTIPFLTVLVQHLNKRQHELLILLALILYTFLYQIPKFNVEYNYITWFGIIFFIASYIRLHPCPLFENRKLWGWLTLASVVIASASIVGLQLLLGSYHNLGFSYYFVSDSNAILAVVIAVCSFLWFKNLAINYSKTINAFGAATFGVLLIHTTGAMVKWLWVDVVDGVGHYYNSSLGNLILYSVGVVLAVFLICNLIDQLRINTLEKRFFKWYDKELATRADTFVNKLIIGNQN